MARIPYVKADECDEIHHCFHCAHAIYTDRYDTEEDGFRWSGTCPNCCRDALGRDREIPVAGDTRPEALYSYKCGDCGARGQVQMTVLTPYQDAQCSTCGASVTAEWDGGVVLQVAGLNHPPRP